MKRLLLIHTGGTLGMSGPHPLRPASYSREILQQVPELARLAEIEPLILMNTDSSDMQPRDWDRIGTAIAERYDDFDGFVVIHGTDTMAYTATALSYSMQNLGKPLILTGSQRPLGEVRTDARANLVGAVELAIRDIPEVGIFFGDRLVRGNRATKRDVWSYAAFDSPNAEPLARVGVGIAMGSNIRHPEGAFHFEPGFDPRVVALRMTPGLPADVLDALADHVHGLVLGSFGAGNVPVVDFGVLHSLRRICNRGIPVVIISQSPEGSVDFSLYEGGQQAREQGAISGGDMTPEAALVKLMYALVHQRTPEDIRAFIEANVAGERTL